MDQILKEKLIKDRVGPEPVLLAVGQDGQSVRVFRERIPGISGSPDFYRITAGSRPEALLMDSATGSEWNLRGCAISGEAKGTCLERIPAVKDYWFDWRNYNPHTSVFGK